MDNNSIYNLEINKLKLILNSFSDAILFESKDRIVEFVNPAFCNLFKIKFPLESVIGSNCEEGIIAASFQFKNPSKFIYRIEEIIEEGNAIAKEEVYLRDGRVIYRDYTPIIINNVLAGHLWVYKETTQLKDKIEVNPSVTNQFSFEEIFFNIPINIAIIDSQKRYLFVNKYALPDANRRNFIIGRTVSEFFKYFSIQSDNYSTREEYLDKTINEGVVSEFELDGTNLLGKTCYTKTTFYPFLDNNGKVEKVIAYSFDISKEKAAEKDLKGLINQYNDALDSISEAVVIANEDLNITYANKAFNNHFSLKEVEDSSIFNFITFKKYEFYKNLFSIMSGENDVVGGKLSDNNEWYNYSIKKGGLANENKQSGIVAILRDITREVNMEENLLEVVKREKELNELKSAFVNMVSHEMRTPLAIISSCAELIQMMLASGKPKEEIETYANHILSEVERMTAFMNDILIISKIEAGKIEFNPEAISLLSFLDDITKKSYLPWKDNRNLEISIKGKEKVFPFDIKMLRHILQNLLDNAFKYSANKPSPKLRVRYSDSFITFSVIDYGIGIHPDDVEKLFSSFSRGRNVGNINGTGIGLVVVKYFVDQHKGSVSIRSRLDSGTIFSIKIPY